MGFDRDYYSSQVQPSIIPSMIVSANPLFKLSYTGQSVEVLPTSPYPLNGYRFIQPTRGVLMEPRMTFVKKAMRAFYDKRTLNKVCTYSVWVNVKW